MSSTTYNFPYDFNFCYRQKTTFESLAASYLVEIKVHLLCEKGLNAFSKSCEPCQTGRTANIDRNFSLS